MQWPFAVPLTGPRASVCIAFVKALVFFSLLAALTSCTTLENRRDLYRSPAEGYERWYPYPPPTRGPATGPVRATTATSKTTPQHGVISFPDE